MKRTKKKLKPIPVLVKDASRLAQLWSRIGRADSDGNCQCITCGFVGHYSELQGGHFIERGKAVTRLDERNIWPQCPGCNLYGMKKASTVLIYRKKLVSFYGEDMVSAMEDSVRQPFKWNREELESLISDLKNRCEEKKKMLLSSAWE